MSMSHCHIIFFFNDTATTEIYTLSLHDALPIWEIFTHGGRTPTGIDAVEFAQRVASLGAGELLVTSMDRDGTKIGYDLELDRKSTRLNSSHANISYAVFCLKKKKNDNLLLTCTT